MQVIKSALKGQRGESHPLLQKAQQPDFGFKHVAFAMAGFAQHYHPRQANFLGQKLQVFKIGVGRANAADDVGGQRRSRGHRLGADGTQQATNQ